MNSAVRIVAALGLLIFTVCPAPAATRLALAGSERDESVANVLDLTTALLSKDADLQLLDRTEVERVLSEQKLALAGLMNAADVVKAGQLLHVDLFAVLEGTLSNKAGESPSLGLVVFDAKSGVRYADSVLPASNPDSAATAAGAALQAAVEKSRLNPKDLHTVGLLSVRNVDLPRQFDGICDTAGLLLERELTTAPGIAVLERRRLEQVNRERTVAPDAEGNRLLASLQMIELDISRDGEGWRGTLALAGANGSRTNTITASLPTRDPAALAHMLAEQIERFLKTPVSRPGNRGAEAVRFHHEYLVLLQHRDCLSAVTALDAAIALDSRQSTWPPEMVMLLPFAAAAYIDPTGLNYRLRSPVQAAPGALDLCLALAQRDVDLLLDLSREAADRTKPGEPVPEIFKPAYRGRFLTIFGRLQKIQITDPSSVAEFALLAGQERALRMEVIEPFLARQSVDRIAFAAYSETISRWLNPTWDIDAASLASDQRTQDDLLAVQHWVEISHKINPPDGSGEYGPIMSMDLFRHPGSQIEKFRRSLEEDQDPVIRLYARAAGVHNHSVDQIFAAERAFRLDTQELLTHGETAGSMAFHTHAWRAIKLILSAVNDQKDGWTEYVEACRFAIDHGEVQPDLFWTAVEFLDSPRHRKLPEELEVVNGALKVVLEKPAAYPAKSYRGGSRSTFISDFQNKHDQLVAAIAGTNIDAAASSPWTNTVCLLDMTRPVSGLAWLFKPMVQTDQVFTVGLGFKEWGAGEDCLQLVRVPLAGGPAAFLGRAQIIGIDWPNRPYVLKAEPRKRLLHPAAYWLDIGRAACIGGGYYFAGTSSGVFIFPLNGDPVLHLDTTNGLPSEDIQSVAILEGKLYIGAGEGYLVVYDPVTRKIEIPASSRRSEHLSPLDDQPPFCAIGLVADPVRHRLLMAASSTVLPNSPRRAITPVMGLWSYRPATGEFKRLFPLRLLTHPRVFRQIESWAGLIDPNTLSIKDLYNQVLFDLSNDRLISVCDPFSTGAISALWGRPIPGFPDQFRLANGPFFLRDGWFYSARPFERMTLPGGRREALPLPPTDYPFEPRESLQLLDDGKHILAADQFSIWLLELKPQPAHASVSPGQ